MEELKKDVETVKVLSVHKSFLENVNDLGILKKKPVHEEAASCSPQKWKRHLTNNLGLNNVKHYDNRV